MNGIKHSRLIVMWDLAWESTYRLQASEIYEERRESGFIKKNGKDRLDHELGSNYATFSLETNRTIREKICLLTATVGMFKAWTTSRGRQI